MTTGPNGCTGCCPASRIESHESWNAPWRATRSRGRKASRCRRWSGDELAALAVTADLMRQAKVGDRVTYVVCRNINFTNVCYVGCKFCAFHTGPNKPGSWDHSLEEVADKAEDAWNRGATEICMQGGLPRA